MNDATWISLGSLALAILTHGILAIVWAVRLEGRMNTRFEVVHERKVALGNRLTAVEKDNHDLRKEIADTIKEGFAEIRSDMKLLRQELARKQDRA